MTPGIGRNNALARLHASLRSRAEAFERAYDAANEAWNAAAAVRHAARELNADTSSSRPTEKKFLAMFEAIDDLVITQQVYDALLDAQGLAELFPTTKAPKRRKP